MAATLSVIYRNNIWVAVILLLHFFPTKLLATAQPIFDIDYSFAFDKNRNFTHLNIAVKSNTFAPNGAIACFWLPYESSFEPNNLGFAARFKALSPKVSDEYFSEGHLNIEKSNTPVRFLRKDLIQIKSKGQLDLHFTAIPPRLANVGKDYYLFDQFYPVLLESCPKPNNFTKTKHMTNLDTEYNLHSSRPLAEASWTHRENSSSKYRPSIVLTRNFKSEQKTLTVDPSTNITFLYKSKYFQDQIPDIIENYQNIAKEIGPYPYPFLYFIETNNTESLAIPGIIAINSPRQFAFKSLQSVILNFNHWIYTQLILSSYINSKFTPNSLCENWIAEGYVDYLASQILKKNPLRRNIVNSYDNEDVLIEFDYQQLQEITAILLKKAEPTLRLSNSAASKDCKQNHPYAFMRHSVALKAALFGLGEKQIFDMAKRVLQGSGIARLSAESFKRELIDKATELTKLEKRRAIRILDSWWQRFQWPDFKLNKVTTRKIDHSTWLNEVKIYRPYSPHTPLPLVLKNGMKETRHIVWDDRFKEQELTISIRTEFEPDEVTLDEHKEVFDFYRFDNTSNFPGLKFFPGNAKTLYPADYTAVWLPTLAKRPGESFSFGINTLILKYLHSNLTLFTQTEPSKGTTAFVLQNQAYLPTVDGQFVANIQKTFLNTFSAEATFTKYHLLFPRPNVFAALTLKSRKVSDYKFEAFSSSKFDLGLDYNKIQDSFFFKVVGSSESVLWIDRDALNYTRNASIIELGTKNFRLLNAQLRLFKGQLTQVDITKGVAEETLFNPNDLNETRLRSDLHFGNTDAITSLNIDIFISAPIPIPEDLMILNRRIQTRLFYDRAESDAGIMTSAGFGFRLPFGGDVSGAGSVPITDVNLLTSLYSSKKDTVSRKPQYFFSLSGNL